MIIIQTANGKKNGIIGKPNQISRQDLLTTVVGKPQQKKCQRLNRLSRDLFFVSPLAFMNEIFHLKAEHSSFYV